MSSPKYGPKRKLRPQSAAQCMGRQRGDFFMDVSSEMVLTSAAVLRMCWCKTSIIA